MYNVHLTHSLLCFEFVELTLYYDSYLCLSKRKGDLGTNVGIGVRYYDSRSEFMDNKLRGYLSIGVSYTL